MIKRTMAWLDLLYVNQFIRPVILQAAAALAMVEAIFLAERFPMIFRDAIRNHASLWDTLMVFLLTAPQILDFGLPLAITVAVYRTVLDMRENRELLVLSACGLSPSSFLRPPAMIAALGLSVSLLASGFINPLALYAQRVVLFHAAYHHLTTPSPQSQLFQSGTRVLFIPKQPKASTDQAKADSRQAIFLYEPIDSTHFRVIQAHGMHAIGSAPQKLLGVSLSRMTSRIFVTSSGKQTQPDAPCCTPQPPASGNADEDALYAETARKLISLDDILPFPPRHSSGTELTLPELLLPIQKTTTKETAVRLVGERLSRALLCLLAPLMALVAIGQTSPRNRTLALPICCMALLACNVATQWLLRLVVHLGLMVELGVLLVLTGLLAALLLAGLTRSNSRLLLPQLYRA